MQQAHANDQLSAYLDGELDAAEVSEVEAALATDPQLRDELAKLDRVAQLLRAHGPVRAPEGFKDAVMAKVAQMPQPQAAPWWRRPFGVPVEGVVLALAAAMVLWVALPANLGPVEADTETPALKTPALKTTAAPAVDPQADVASAAAPPQQMMDPDTDPSDGVATLDEGTLGDNGQGKEGDLNSYDPYVTGTGKGPQKARPSKQNLGWDNTGNTADLGTAPSPSPIDNTGLDNTGGMAEAPAEEAQEKLPPTLPPKPQLSAGVAYTLYADDPGKLLDIRRIVGAHGGTLTDENGRALSLSELNSSTTLLMLNLPSKQVPEVIRKLRAVGALKEMPSNSNKLYGAQMVVNLTVKLTGGSSQTYGSNKNAARSKQQQHADDAMESSEVIEAL